MTVKVTVPAMIASFRASITADEAAIVAAQKTIGDQTALINTIRMRVKAHIDVLNGLYELQRVAPAEIEII